MSIVVVEDSGMQAESSGISGKKREGLADSFPDPTPGLNLPWWRRVQLRPRTTPRSGSEIQTDGRITLVAIASPSITPRKGFIQRVQKVVYRGARVVSLSCWLDCPSERW